MASSLAILTCLFYQVLVRRVRLLEQYSVTLTLNYFEKFENCALIRTNTVYTYVYYHKDHSRTVQVSVQLLQLSHNTSLAETNKGTKCTDIYTLTQTNK